MKSKKKSKNEFLDLVEVPLFVNKNNRQVSIALPRKEISFPEKIPKKLLIPKEIFWKYLRKKRK